MGSVEDKLFDWIDSNGLFESSGRVLLAVSGGADSVVMAHALERLREAGRLECGFVIGHVNHNLRGADSDGDEVFVSELGRELNIDVLNASVPVREYAAENKLSVETAGRVLRLKALAQMARENGCAAIATAHHKDDLAETVIHRLMRGTGFRGLCGIRPASVVYGARFIRLMLTVRRSEIIQYADEQNLSWRRDASNKNVGFTRNRIRHHLLPVLEAENDVIVDRLFALSQKAREFLAQTETQAKLLVERGRLEPAEKQFCIEQEMLGNCPPWVLYEVLRSVLVKLGVGLRNYKQEHFEAMQKMLEQQKARADFPGGIGIAVSDGFVRFKAKTGQPVEQRKPVVLSVGQTVQYGPWRICSRLLERSEVDLEAFLKTKDSFTEWFDADRIAGKIEIRQRRDGDRFWPIGASSEKKVGRFLQDAGLDTGTKRKAFVIADAEKILWLAPLRMAEQAKITDKTTRIFEIRVDA